MRTVIFDLDGTLADTSGDLLAAANTALGQDVLSGPGDNGTALRGGRAMLRLGLSRMGHADTPAQEERVNALYQPLLEVYAKNLAVHTVLYPGVEAALDALEAMGCAVGICTNKPEYLAEDLMTRLGVRDRFASLVGADTLPVRKPAPEPVWEAIDRAGGDRENALLVGDSDTDRNAARNAGVQSLLVTFGPAGDDMDALSPDGLLPDYGALAGCVQRMLKP
ncbi:MAG: HAD hydrolase-like protein [Pseudomonadota bacterium]